MDVDWRYVLVGAGLLGGAIFYFHIGHVIDYEIIRPAVAREAREYADKVGKPMINIGCGETDWGDVNVDIVPRNVKGFMQLDVSKPMPFKDKEFGSALASHILEHLEDPDSALAEWHRIADRVYVLVPSLWNAWSWLTPEHKWVFLCVPHPRIRIPYR
jgi:SAM-dependent methyltransferase